MIVETMSHEEVAQEIIYDFPIVHRKAQYVLDKIKRDLIKSKKFPFLKIYEYVSPSKNKWLFVINVISKKEHHINCTNYHYTNIGFRACYYMSDGTSDKIAFFNGHFFARYAERKNLNIVDPLEKVKNFLLTNRYVSFKKQKGDDLKIVGIINDGMVFGRKITPTIAIFNTFITPEMMSEEQAAIFKLIKVDEKQNIRSLENPT